jgi:acyl-CoA thioesterase FadM
LDFAGVGLIMNDVAVEFKNEIFYGERIIASVTVSDISKFSFDVYYKLEKENNDKRILVALAKTGMVCYNYGSKKVAGVPKEVKDKLE